MEDKDFEELRLGRLFCFPLYSCSRMVIKMFSDLLEPLDLTYTQFLAMAALWESGSMSVRALGDKMTLDSGTLTPLLKKLEKKHLVYRCRSAVDERMLIISATEEGMALREAALGIPEQVADSLSLTKAELEQLTFLLNKMMTVRGAD